MVTSQLLWGKYIQYVRDGEGALLDPVTLDSVYLDRGEVTDLSAVPPTATHKALAELGFTPDSPRADQREALHNRLHQLDLDPVPVRISGLRVVLTDACNMKCSYCFVETNTGKPDMTEQEIADGLTYLFETNAGRDEVAIQWFGGEPTTRFDLMQHGDTLADSLAAQYDVKRVRRTVVTNGARITDAMIEHFARYEYGVGISIDGPPAINAEHRRLLGGQPADGRIRRNVRRLLDAGGIHVGCNLTPTPANIGRLAETVTWIIDDLGLKFIYANTPIPTSGRWTVKGRELARELYQARLVALGRGGMMFSVLDRAFQALDRRRPMLFDHIQSDRTLNVALLPGNRVSLCDINFTAPSFLHTLDELRADPNLLGGIAKHVAPIPECGQCPALAICGGPSRNEQLLIGGDRPDPQMCDFYTSTVEIAVWDSTGVQ
ncbi:MULTISPECIES: radical SAM protein [unclassified Streptomyces]|uniref:radical SAM protein n=1 Tax=unclassified Streptomyces TaxID=2593676 RepID=UPI001F013FAE|nr:MULTISPECIES: radical SAM protein [unclassified Streptomyces]UJV43932.1 radical SAM protein [Streptomyces sp. AMCC400023]WNZ11953.1 radical SAM protein [Streptomyces sp. 11x1]